MFFVFFLSRRVTIFSLNQQRQIEHYQTTGLKTIQLERNEETRLLILDPKITFPILISLNLLVCTPDRTYPMVLGDAAAQQPDSESIPSTDITKFENANKTSLNDSNSNNNIVVNNSSSDSNVS